MNFIADLHIHSHYSLATSSELVLPQLDVWARKKGITVVGTGDATHPGWLAEIKRDLFPVGNGLYRLSADKKASGAGITGSAEVNFMLSAEISCIYKFGGKVRKVHLIVLSPDCRTFELIQQKLSARGNIVSDGRPILGIDVRDLLEIILTVNNRVCCIPAHIWTPWFSVLGSKSGFDTIDECFRDLSGEIFALETGLSSDPVMNRQCSFLDRFALVSNSDAHSPEKLGREGTLFTADCSYDGIISALRHPSKGLSGTIEYFPEEGKYHLDGHRACQVCFEPDETQRHDGVCPVCRKPLTIGVLSRVATLADRKNGRDLPALLPYHSLTGLKSIVAERFSMGEQSKKVRHHYESMIAALGSEFSILMDVPFEALCTYDIRLAEGILRLRAGKVDRTGGYDGVFGKIKVFTDRHQ